MSEFIKLTEHGTKRKLLIATNCIVMVQGEMTTVDGREMPAVVQTTMDGWIFIEGSIDSVADSLERIHNHE